jgi:hypothetical protein
VTTSPRSRPKGGRWEPPKTFALGVGCQKGGTTWLHRYLAGSPQCAPGYRKEYHVFDSKDLASEEWMRDRILGMADDELQKARRGEPADAVQLHRASMYADPEFYYDYFAGLLRSERRIRLTADMTPDYAMLSVERIAEIKASFEKRRVRTVSIFLMRDPVERIWSQIRMQHKRRPERFPAPSEDMVAKLYDDPLYEVRTRYDATFRALDSVFDQDHIYYGFYERLFDEAEIQKVCDLVGIKFRRPNFDKRANASAKVVSALPDDLVRTVAHHYRDVYHAVAERFEIDNLPELWPNSRFVI